jgi:hypothetical protein
MKGYRLTRETAFLLHKGGCNASSDSLLVDLQLPFRIRPAPYNFISLRMELYCMLPMSNNALRGLRACPVSSLASSYARY